MKLFCTLLFTLIFCATNAQQNFYEEWYSAELENIPQNSIKSIVPDKYGFIWMTTENGLLRFDGKNFKVFNSVNSNFVSNRFSYISGNIKKDSLTTSTAYNFDLLLINKRTIHKKTITNEERNKPYLNIGTYEDVLYYNNYINEPQVTFKSTEINCENGNYYLIGEKKISLYNKKRKIIKELYQSYKKNTAYFLYDNELILLDYKDNSYTLSGNEFSVTYKLILPEKSKLIYNYVVQQFFVYAENKILLLSKKGNQLSFIPLFSKPKINLNIKSLYFDKNSNKLFIGTNDKGLNVVSINNSKILINPINSNNNYYGSYQLSDNEFITTKGEVFNEKGLVSVIKVYNTDQQQSITIDQQKNIWIPNGQDLIKYFKSTNYKTIQTFKFDYKIGALYCDVDNKIWVGMDLIARNNAKLYTVDANIEGSKPLIIKNINKPIMFFAKNHKNEMFMVCKDHLLIYDLKKQKIRSVPNGKNEIRSVFIAKDNSVWICTFNNGISLFENDTFYKMPFDNKMYLLSAHCIKEDNNNHFWISTNKGIIEVTKKSLLNYHINKTPVYYHHYNVKNGFLTNEFNGGCQPCGINLKNNFVFPSLNGMVLFDPDKVKKILPSNNFYINEADLDGKTVYFNNIILIDRNTNRTTFKIDYAYKGNQDNVSFEVKLNLSENAKWVNLHNEKEISYTNLPPGVYTLYVRKIKAFSSEYEIKKITVCVPAHFYEKLWFKFLILTLIIIVLFLIIKIRLKLIRDKNIALEIVVKHRTSDLFDTVENLEIAKNNLYQEILQQKKLIGTISHDIKSPLRFLSITAKHLYEKSLLSLDENLKDNAKAMQESANELYRFVENLVDYSKVFIEYNDIQKFEEGSIDEVIKQKINLFKNLAHQNNVSINYENLANIPINLNKKVIGIIIHNLLDNAIKNTFSGTITIITKVIKNKIYISVEDTGAGMSKEIKDYYINIQKNYETDKLAIQNYGLGLHMILELLRLLKGDLKIYSKDDKGTKITIITDIN